jgi:hypothetical protein
MADHRRNYPNIAGNISAIFASSFLARPAPGIETNAD